MARTPLVLALAFILALGLGLRAAAWDWGLVTEADLRAAGYPDSLLPDDASRWAGGSAGSYYGSYAYDEETFGAALPMLLRLRHTCQQCAEAKPGLFACLQNLYLAAYADIDMAASPVAAIYFGAATWLAAHAAPGSQIHWNTVSESTVRHDLRTVLLRWGRWFALPWLLFAAGVFLWYWRKLAGLGPGGLMIGLAVFLVQPNLLTHGRLLTYNFMVLGFELGLLALCLRGSGVESEDGTPVAATSGPFAKHRWLGALATGILGGLGLATKMTLAPVLAVTLAHALMQAWRLKPQTPGNQKPHPWRPWHLPLPGFRASRWEFQPRACLPFLLFLGAALLTWFFIVYPALHAAEGGQTLRYAERTWLGREDLQAGTPWGRAWIYFTQTLPAAMGWPLYLLGLGGIAQRLYRWRRATSLERVTLAFLLLTMALYTTNPLGLAVQRTLTVIALFMIFAARALADTYRALQSSPAFWRRRLVGMVAVFVLCGMLYAAFATTRLFRFDQPGYRQGMAAWMLQHLPAGDTIWLEGRDPHTLTDLALIETLPPTRHRTRYHWEFRLPEDYARLASQTDSLRVPTGHSSRVDRLPWGHYYAHCACGTTASAIFVSPAKIESPWARRLRMAFGYHRWDQILIQPDFAVYAPTSTSH